MQRLAFGLLKLGAERHHFDAQTQRGKKDFAKSGVIAPGQQNTVAFAQRPAAIKLRHRPARYVITKDKLITCASEVGIWDYQP
ncbi:hypothetical protein FK513_31775, partial [Klebsiella pneumoniae]|nr:hypothetical protein [Klebsiella pneumoniae]